MYFNTNISPLLQAASTIGNTIWFEQDQEVIYIGASGAFSAIAPSSAVYPGDAGMAAFDSSYIYLCTSTNTWKRAAIATW